MEAQSAQRESKKSKQEQPIKFPKMDEFESSFFKPSMTQAEINEAELELQTSSDLESFEDLQELCLKTWKLQRNWIGHEIKGKTKEQVNIFIWLLEVSLI